MDSQRLIESQSDLYTGVLLGTLAVTLMWEIWFPRRTQTAPRTGRWRLNFLLLAINMVVLYALVPITTVTLALVVSDAGWGLFNRVQIPFGAVVVVSVLVMDCARYGQHYLLHRVPVLWRIHRVHHADPDLDVTTSLRFHPVETIAGVLTDALAIAVFGVPALAVVIYRLARVAASTIVHGNVRIPPGLERWLRLVLVTPDMHRIHHSVLEHEQRGNLSGGLSWWDYLFGTYVGMPAGDYRTMALGLSGYSAARANSLRATLLDPLAK
jgi:sterol desaturase/sphingolipid hydroxylase (fatty acid hydroxylase superfamily)